MIIAASNSKLIRPIIEIAGYPAALKEIAPPTVVTVHAQQRDKMRRISSDRVRERGRSGRRGQACS
jgi:hypothetical protein